MSKKSLVSEQSLLSVRGARVHNLKNVDIDIPRDTLTVITGLSGSGKSSLAFDTIYAEGQRRYVESLSAYARQFLGVMDKPDVDRIDGLSPAIAIDQKSVSKNPRSTVGTITEIYDYLRLLYARAGVVHCPKCGREVKKQSVQQMIEQLVVLPDSTKLILMAPIVRDRKGEHRLVFDKIERLGFVRVRIDGVVMELSEAMQKPLQKQQKHTIDVVVDRLVLDALQLDTARLSESIETVLRLSEGFLSVGVTKPVTGDEKPVTEELLFSEHFACERCHVNLPDIEPRLFSFNSPHGACTTCTGLGLKLEVDPRLVVSNARLTIAEGAIRPWSKTASRSSWNMRTLYAVAEQHGFSLDEPFYKLKRSVQKLVLFGVQDGSTVRITGSSDRSQYEMDVSYEGVIPRLERRHKETDSEYVRQDIEQYMREMPCPSCDGRRLKDEALAVTIADRGLYEVVSGSISSTLEFFEDLQKRTDDVFSASQKDIAHPILQEVVSRLQFLVNVGLDYLTLDRSATTLSGGEAQRIRLATQIGSQLVGVLYVLDEPSIGLHQRDNQRLISTLEMLRDIGNTVLVVEHDEDMMRAADVLIDIGPGAGEHGGEIVGIGTPAEIAASDTLTGEYLSGRRKVSGPKKRRKGNGEKLLIKGAREHNLKNIDVEIPLGMFTCVTGVSGSGKSSLVNDILARDLAHRYHRAKQLPGIHDSIEGTEHLNKVVVIDQSPIGRTPRSNPATYTGVFTPIRDLFAKTQEAKVRGYNAGRFSFNVKGGRCEDCQGDGVKKIEMHFLPDVYVECEECDGLRYNDKALEIQYKGVTIAEILDMTIDHALTFFQHIPTIQVKLQTLVDVGLGYVRLGQSATTLSGGEAQRIKLATELSRRATGKTLYILDEPTTGLHFEDVSRLLVVLQRLVDKGNSLLVIEHNLDVIRCSDHIIDIGPEGGDRGGEVVVTGTPEKVVKCTKGYTASFLR